jgi:adenosylcobinamide-GDP ribazoletransferase
VLLVALLALITGGLHLDGLADLFDALGGGRGERARMLELMRDPRIGAHGATALVLVLFAKCALFDAGVRAFSPEAWLCIPAFARLAIVPLIVWLPPARPDGLSNSVAGASAVLCLLPNALLAIFACVLAPSLAFGLLAALLPSLLLGFWAARRLSGTTGDVLGAVVELSELAAAIVLITMAS